MLTASTRPERRWKNGNEGLGKGKGRVCLGEGMGTRWGFMGYAIL